MRRPDCFEFAMDFLGEPEAPALRAYIGTLERAQPRCASCLHWSPVQHPADPEMLVGGWCTSDKLGESDSEHSPDALRYGFSEGGGFWTGPEFGCVHHRPVLTPKNGAIARPVPLAAAEGADLPLG